ncbi:anti-anti-sigma regulatory factor [Streptomyces sp. 846.5]|nr:STAS domain-containing protein [Streptomyces sp. 846.5]TDT97971.1 anti-anti-sigma regulatory factor [Streptomyces sp. 846.5]
MSAPHPGTPSVHRHDTPTSALVTLVGDIGPDTMPLLREALEGRLHDGVRTIDVDLTSITGCGFSGLDALLSASQHAGMAGVALRLHLHLPPPSLARLFDLTGTGFLVTGLACGRLQPLTADPGHRTRASWCTCCEPERQYATPLQPVPLPPPVPLPESLPVPVSLPLPAPVPLPPPVPLPMPVAVGGIW